MLARQLARSSSNPVIVYDPTQDQRGPNVAGWSADFVTPDWDEFVGVFWASEGCLAIIDESPDVFRSDPERARMMLRRGRHKGHVVALLSVRYTQMDKTAREQCTRLYAFNQSKSDGKILAEDYNCDALEECYRLQTLNYIRVDKMGGACRGVVKV